MSEGSLLSLVIKKAVKNGDGVFGWVQKALPAQRIPLCHAGYNSHRLFGITSQTDPERKPVYIDFAPRLPLSRAVRKCSQKNRSASFVMNLQVTSTTNPVFTMVFVQTIPLSRIIEDIIIFYGRGNRKEGGGFCHGL